MRTSLSIGIAAFAALAFAGTAEAGHFTGWYGGLEGGVSTISNESVGNDTDDGFWAGGFPPTDSSFKTGWGVFGKVGWAWPMFHLEGELGYRSNDLDKFNVQGTDYTGGGSVHEFSQMINLLYTPSLTDKIDLSLGAGIGGDYINYKNNSGWHTVPISDNDYVFAWQLLAGLSWHMGMCGSMDCDLQLNYRYFRAESPEFTSVDGGGHLHNDTYDQLDKHTVTIGIVFH